jgi:hypothetical protein
MLMTIQRLQLGKGVVGFMRATLGFEQEIMREGMQLLPDSGYLILTLSYSLRATQ